MYNIKTYNKISAIGLDEFDKTAYTCGDEVADPVGAIVRSAALHDVEFPDTLLAIARAGAGTNNIPVDRCAEEGIVVFNTPGANANAVKELVIAGLLICSRRVIPAIKWAETLKGNGDEVGKMVEKGKGAFVGPEIKGKSIGVIGLGAIGVLVANAANALGMKVYGYDPYLSVDAAWNLTHNAIHAIELNEIYEKCDYITLHVPLTPDTKGLINKDTIAKCKDGVRILNFARGDLVNSADLLNALDDGKVAAYVTDFPSDDVIGADGVIAIPHLGASTPESEDNCAMMAAAELIDYIENGNIVNSVNMPNISMPKSGDERICVIHKNVPSVINKITGIVSGANININNMLNKSKKDFAYTMLDLEEKDLAKVDAIANAIGDMDEVIRVRVIR
ncbi:MAG: 3-phosphoglycerate dehydrogenase [Clostridia bacterium]|nr:3-phosphoglycerate dehydrogenase [Clostridia bacterium]MBO5912301.1 3-phosphoglycerate dehydrogenase [Clostridia bacterium]